MSDAFEGEEPVAILVPQPLLHLIKQRFSLGIFGQSILLELFNRIFQHREHKFFFGTRGSGELALRQAGIHRVDRNEGFPMLKNHVLGPQTAVPHFYHCCRTECVRRRAGETRSKENSPDVMLPVLCLPRAVPIRMAR